MLRVGALILTTALVSVAPSPAWAWPTASHVVVRGFAAPATEYAEGHRGIDVAAPTGSDVHAVADGVVAFAGTVADRGVVAIDHGGVRSSVEPVDGTVHEGETVRRGELIGHVAAGGSHGTGRLHLGARIRTPDGWAYISPLLLLGGVERAVLLPLSAW